MIENLSLTQGNNIKNGDWVCCWTYVGVRILWIASSDTSCGSWATIQ